MPNHKSASKKVRSDESKRLLNSYQRKSCYTFIKQLQHTSERKTATELLPRVVAMIDKLSKRGIIHKNKSSRLKSKVAKHVNSVSA